MSIPKDRDVIAEASGRLAKDVLVFVERHNEAERERIIAEVMKALDKSTEPLDPQWSVQKWIELHAASSFQSRMRRLVAKGAAAAERNAGMHPDIG